MVTHVRIGSVENCPALTRLAGKARTDGIRLFRDRAGRYYASSASTPGTFHFLTGYSCDCRGFMTHHRCKHHSALMVALGWIDDDPTPEPPVTIANTCSECQGQGQVSGTVSTGSTTWRYGSICCPDCHGSGETTVVLEVA
jgi:hypothetical protein